MSWMHTGDVAASMPQWLRRRHRSALATARSAFRMRDRTSNPGLACDLNETGERMLADAFSMAAEWDIGCYADGDTEGGEWT